VRPWHKRAFVVSSTRIPPTQTDRRWMRKEIYLDAGKKVQEQIETLRAFQPHVIYGYSNSLKLIAHAIRQSNAKELSPYRVFGFAELLGGQDRS